MLYISLIHCGQCFKDKGHSKVLFQELSVNNPKTQTEEPKILVLLDKRICKRLIAAGDRRFAAIMESGFL
jgi:hypothetical protein